MANGAADSTFIDTNILIYATASSSPFHHAANRSISQLRTSGAELWISRQVIREYLAVLSRPQEFAHPLRTPELTASILRLESFFRIAEDGPEVMRLLVDIIEQCPVAGKQIHDANIVATMRACGIAKLLTNNIGDFQRFSKWIEIITLQDLS